MTIAGRREAKRLRGLISLESGSVTQALPSYALVVFNG